MLLFMRRPEGLSSRQRLRQRRHLKGNKALLGLRCGAPCKSGISSSASVLLAASSSSVLSSPGHFYNKGTSFHRKGDQRATEFLPNQGDMRGGGGQSDLGADVQEAVDGVRYVADHMMGNDDDQSVSDDMRNIYSFPLK